MIRKKQAQFLDLDGESFPVEDGSDLMDHDEDVVEMLDTPDIEDPKDELEEDPDDLTVTDVVEELPKDAPEDVTEDTLEVSDTVDDDEFEDSNSVDDQFDVVVMDEPIDISKEFEIPFLPGAEDQSPLDVDSPKDEEDIVVVESDPNRWSIPTFLDWARGMAEKCPRHSGRDVSGLERAIAYFKWLSGEFSKATQQDIRGELDVAEVEKLRDQIHDGIDRLVERLDQVSEKYNKTKKKKKKSSSEEFGLIKEARSAAFTVVVPLFISHIARICINSAVSAGHDIEIVFDKLSKKFDLTARENAEVMQLLEDMNYPLRRDRGFLVDEKVDQTSSDNFDWAANYQA